MKKKKNLLAKMLVIGALLTGVIPCSSLAQPSGVKRTNLQQHDLSIPGREVVQVRVDIDSGVTFPKHTHPGEEIIYVLEGMLEYQLEGKAPMTVRAGDVLFIPAHAVHTAKNIGSNNASELATYVVEKGKPILVVVR